MRCGAWGSYGKAATMAALGFSQAWKLLRGSFEAAFFSGVTNARSEAEAGLAVGVFEEEVAAPGVFDGFASGEEVEDFLRKFDMNEACPTVTPFFACGWGSGFRWGSGLGFGVSGLRFRGFMVSVSRFRGSAT